MARLLIVDDEPNLLYSLQRSLRSGSLEVLTASTGRRGLELVRASPPDVAVLDVRLPDMSGLEAFDRIREIDPRLPVILITAYASTDTAIEAMKRGAFEYLLKPVEFQQLRDLVAKAVALSHVRHVPAVFEPSEQTDGEVVRIVGRSAPMQEVYKAIGRVAPQDLTVLITGESGTGKELVARAIYHHSPRSVEPFLALNCAALPETLLESELFGHERGAFTGAERRRIGKFEQTHGGTLFLDEIGDMAPGVQAKVLRLLQERCFERIGGNETIESDVRLIAATNQDLEKLVSQGRFRTDLFYRLKVFTIQLPPLRERLDDLPVLVEHWVKVCNRELGKEIRSVSPEVLERLAAHAWPGNVRELQSVLKYALVHATGEVLTADCLPDSLWGGDISSTGPEVDAQAVAGFVRQLLRSGATDLYTKITLAVDRIVLQEVLRHARGNQVRASELLGISRTTLRAKLRTLDLSITKQVLLDAHSPGEDLDSGDGVPQAR
jgi:nitrogen regulation protein NR(I)